MRLRKLVRVGNSHALIIDATTLRAMGIKADTEFRVWSQDGRIHAEPNVRVDRITFAMRRKERVLRDRAHVFARLLDRGLEFEAWGRLAGGMRVLAYDAAVKRGADVDPLLAKRLEACLVRLEAGDKWDAAVDHVLARHPGVVSDLDP